MRDLNTGGRAGSCDVITQIRDYGGVIGLHDSKPGHIDKKRY